MRNYNVKSTEYPKFIRETLRNENLTRGEIEDILIESYKKINNYFVEALIDQDILISELRGEGRRMFKICKKIRTIEDLKECLETMKEIFKNNKIYGFINLDTGEIITEERLSDELDVCKMLMENVNGWEVEY